MHDGAEATLDNPVWHALTGPQSPVAVRARGARRFDPEVAPFAAVPDEPGPGSWSALADLVGPGGVALLFRIDTPEPAGWEVLPPIPCDQMVLPPDREVDAAPGARVARTLGPDDLPEMLDLVERTRPGPFLRRTIELGTYLGVREAGRLVGMAGERMRLPGATEVSAVCTDPDVQGRGIASDLVRDLVSRIRARGEIPFLHVAHGNDRARRTYEHLGFVVRRAVTVHVLRAAPDGGTEGAP